MVVPEKQTSEKSCTAAGFYWWDDSCHRERNPAGMEQQPDWFLQTAAEVAFALHGKDLMEHGEGLFGAWTNLAFQEPPEDLIGRIFWSAGILGQLIISVFTFPAALGSFLLEESVQAYGMGAYMLTMADAWTDLYDYVEGYETFVDSAEVGAKTLATLSPMTGGAVLIYMQAAKMQARAMKHTAEVNILRSAEKDEILRQKLLNDALYGTVRLSSSPSSAEIWLDGINTERLTPETLKNLAPGSHTFEVRKYSTKRESWDIFVFDTDVSAGYKKEILARIPPGITSPGEDTPDPETSQIRLTSNPINAEIWLDEADTGLLTPETFKNVEPGTYNYKLRSFSKRRDMWDEYELALSVEANKKYEFNINIPAGTSTEEDPSGDTEEEEDPQLPQFMKARVTGDYAIDGDTFVTSTGERIRVLGIDAPELGQPYSNESKEMLHDMISGKTVYLKIQVSVPLDIYGRTLAICTTSRGTQAYLLLIEGLARVFIASDATYDDTYYYTAETLAKERKVGIWKELP